VGFQITHYKLYLQMLSSYIPDLVTFQKFLSNLIIIFY